MCETRTGQQLAQLHVSLMMMIMMMVMMMMMMMMMMVMVMVMVTDPKCTTGRFGCICTDK